MIVQLLPKGSNFKSTESSERQSRNIEEDTVLPIVFPRVVWPEKVLICSLSTIYLEVYSVGFLITLISAANILSWWLYYWGLYCIFMRFISFNFTDLWTV